LRHPPEMRRFRRKPVFAPQALQEGAYLNKAAIVTLCCVSKSMRSTGSRLKEGSS